MPKLRLDKIIADSGLYSRSEAAAIINSGRVSVGGRVACSVSEKCDPETECVAIDGVKLEYRRFRYIMMNKPRGYVSSTADKREKTVLELLDDKYRKLDLFPAGRLDKDAEGLLLLTNDGRLAHIIISPSSKIYKRYFVQIDDEISNADITAFANGIELGDGTKCRPAILENASGGAYVTIHEGKYHQVKRMMSAIGKPVKYLKRIAIGGLVLDDNLKPGEFLEITDEISLILCDK